MRSTLTISDDVDKVLRKLAQNEHLTYKEAVNLALKKGLEGLLAAEAPPAYIVESFDAGFQPGVDLGSLNRLADEIEEKH